MPWFPSLRTRCHIHFHYLQMKMKKKNVKRENLSSCWIWWTGLPGDWIEGHWKCTGQCTSCVAPHSPRLTYLSVPGGWPCSPQETLRHQPRWKPIVWNPTFVFLALTFRVFYVFSHLSSLLLRSTFNHHYYLFIKCSYVMSHLLLFDRFIIPIKCVYAKRQG